MNNSYERHIVKRLTAFAKRVKRYLFYTDSSDIFHNRYNNDIGNRDVTATNNTVGHNRNIAATFNQITNQIIHIL